jgi:hypothetical protein
MISLPSPEARTFQVLSLAAPNRIETKTESGKKNNTGYARRNSSEQNTFSEAASQVLRQLTARRESRALAHLRRANRSRPGARSADRLNTPGPWLKTVDSDRARQGSLCSTLSPRITTD